MLVDEDERLYDAFQALDEDGDGLISKEELDHALVEHEKKTRGKGKIVHHRRDSTASLLDTLRVQSAFGTLAAPSFYLSFVDDSAWLTLFALGQVLRIRTMTDRLMLSAYTLSPSVISIGMSPFECLVQCAV